MLLDCGAKYKLQDMEILVVVAMLSALTLNSVQHGYNEERQKEIENKFYTLFKNTLKQRRAEFQDIVFSDNDIN